MAEALSDRGLCERIHTYFMCKVSAAPFAAQIMVHCHG